MNQKTYKIERSAAKNTGLERQRALAIVARFAFGCRGAEVLGLRLPAAYILGTLEMRWVTFMQNLMLPNGVRIDIRPARDSDLTAILRIEERSFPNPYPLGYLRFLLRLNPTTFIVAENDKGVVGYLIGDIRSRNEGHIISLAVRENERRRGIARALMDSVSSELQRLGVLAIRLEVRASNKPAINLYHSLGYREAGVMARYYRDGEDAISMVARIGVSRGESALGTRPAGLYEVEPSGQTNYQEDDQQR